MIDPGETHGYRVAARQGDHVHVDVIQSRMDVVLSARDPDGRAVGEFDSPTGPLGPEAVRPTGIVGSPLPWAHQDADRLRAAADTRRQSLTRYEAAADLWRAVPDLAGQAAALRAKGFAHVRLGDDDRAMAVFQVCARAGAGCVMSDPRPAPC